MCQILLYKKLTKHQCKRDEITESADESNDVLPARGGEEQQEAQLSNWWWVVKLEFVSACKWQGKQCHLAAQVSFRGYFEKLN